MAANAGTKLHGKNGSIWICATGATQVKVANKAEWTLNLNRDYVDATTFGNTNKVYLVGLKDISGTYAGLLDTSGDLLVNAVNSDAMEVYLYGDDSTLIANGKGLIDAAITASNTDAIRVTGNFRASANWTVFTGA